MLIRVAEVIKVEVEGTGPYAKEENVCFTEKPELCRFSNHHLGF